MEGAGEAIQEIEKFIDNVSRYALTLEAEIKDLRSGEYLARVIEERDRYRKALERIAAYDDNLANEYLSKHGSYAGFDEPGSVMVSRSTLAVKS
ncbi:hypothetical protein [Microcystis phage Mwe-JY13]